MKRIFNYIYIILFIFLFVVFLILPPGYRSFLDLFLINKIAPSASIAIIITSILYIAFKNFLPREVRTNHENIYLALLTACTVAVLAAYGSTLLFDSIIKSNLKFLIRNYVQYDHNPIASYTINDILEDLDRLRNDQIEITGTYNITERLRKYLDDSRNHSLQIFLYHDKWVSSNHNINKILHFIINYYSTRTNKKIKLYIVSKDSEEAKPLYWNSTNVIIKWINQTSVDNYNYARLIFKKYYHDVFGTLGDDVVFFITPDDQFGNEFKMQFFYRRSQGTVYQELYEMMNEIQRSTSSKKREIGDVID